MAYMNKNKLKADLTQAFIYAITTVGMEDFKKTSMFASNEKKVRVKR